MSEQSSADGDFYEDVEPLNTDQETWLKLGPRVPIQQALGSTTPHPRPPRGIPQQKRKEGE